MRFDGRKFAVLAKENGGKGQLFLGAFVILLS